MWTLNASPTNSIPGCSPTGCRVSPTPARCGSRAGSGPFRASSAMGRKSIASGCRSMTRWRGLIFYISPIIAHCHSMPSVGVSREDKRRPDIVLGDRYGTSCAGALADVVDETFTALGYSVGRNKPYAGGFITEHYGSPANGTHTIQIELNRAIYMDERRRERGPQFRKVAADFSALAEALTALRFDTSGPFQAAAK